ncbi:MAG: thioredoxin domain-containing protein [archaeon]|jgi:hypothetical protein
MDENKHEHQHEKREGHNLPNKKNQFGNIKIWQTSTIILTVAVVVLIGILASSFANASSASGIAKGQNLNLSGQTVADETVAFINANLLQGQATAKLDSVEEANGLYLLNLDVSGQKMPTYVSSDGKLFFPQVIDLTKKPDLQQTQEVQVSAPKSSKPSIELFVMSHCPYGTQMEKGILPVVKELGNKIDFKIKFVNYAMHPSKGEVQEQLNQFCIQQEFPEKYTAYLGKFLEAGDSNASLGSVGLSTTDISKCVEETDKSFDVIKNLEDKSSWINGTFPKFLINNEDNLKYGVQGSPTLVINGQIVQSGRDAQSLMNAVCNAFDNKPAECNTNMSSFGNPAPGFGFDTQGGSATTAGCGA